MESTHWPLVLLKHSKIVPILLYTHKLQAVSIRGYVGR